MITNAGYSFKTVLPKVEHLLLYNVKPIIDRKQTGILEKHL